MIQYASSTFLLFSIPSLKQSSKYGRNLFNKTYAVTYRIKLNVFVAAVSANIESIVNLRVSLILAWQVLTSKWNTPMLHKSLLNSWFNCWSSQVKLRISCIRFFFKAMNKSVKWQQWVHYFNIISRCRSWQLHNQWRPTEWVSGTTILFRIVMYL